MSVKAKVGDNMKYIIRPKMQSLGVSEWSKCSRDCILRCWEFLRY